MSGPTKVQLLTKTGSVFDVETSLLSKSGLIKTLLEDAGMHARAFASLSAAKTLALRVLLFLRLQATRMSQSHFQV